MITNHETLLLRSFLPQKLTFQRIVDFHEIYLHIYVFILNDQCSCATPTFKSKQFVLLHTIVYIDLLKIDRECMEIVIFTSAKILSIHDCCMDTPILRFIDHVILNCCYTYIICLYTCQIKVKIISNSNLGAFC